MSTGSLLTIIHACIQKPDGGNCLSVVHVDPACIEEMLMGVTRDMYIEDADKYY